MTGKHCRAVENKRLKDKSCGKPKICESGGEADRHRCFAGACQHTGNAQVQVTEGLISILQTGQELPGQSMP